MAIRFTCKLDIKWLPYSAWYRLFPAHWKVNIFLFSGGVLSTVGTDIVLK